MKRNFGGAGLPFWAWEGNTTCAWLGLPAGTPVKRVKYPASLAPRSIDDGVQALSAHRRVPRPLFVFAHSQGAQVVSRWLRERSTTADPDRIEFLLIGNPLRKYGGYGVGHPEVDGRTGAPTPTGTLPRPRREAAIRRLGRLPRYRRSVAVANANRDRCGINGTRAIHAMGYRTATLDDPARKTYREGLTEFVMLPHALSRHIRPPRSKPDTAGPSGDRVKVTPLNIARFLSFGSRMFAPARTSGRVPFQPILYFFLWAAAVPITFNDERIPDIPFRQVLAGWAETMWDILAIGCPPLALIAWVMITHLRPRIKLCGHWLRLTADFGMVIALLTYHIATAVHYGFKDDEHIFPLHVRVMHPVHVRADRPRRLDPHRDRPPRGRDSRWPIPITSSR